MGGRQELLDKLHETRRLFAGCYLMECFFFFFQAEDGIRDLTVTGVQTCALPIWPRDGGAWPRPLLARHPARSASCLRGRIETGLGVCLAKPDGGGDHPHRLPLA